MVMIHVAPFVNETKWTADEKKAAIRAHSIELMTSKFELMKREKDFLVTTKTTAAAAAAAN